MRIALVIERFEPGRGGVESVAWTVAHGLAARGVDVTVVARRTAPEPGVPVRRVSVPSFWQPLRVLAFSRAAARASADGFDLVQSFSRTRRQDVYRAGGGCHADYLARQHPGPGGWLRRLSPRHATLLWLERGIFADAGQRIVCNSALVRDVLRRRYGLPEARMAVIYNGVDTARFRPDPQAEAIRRQRETWGAGDACVWLFAGSGWDRKGLDTALRALARGPADTLLCVAGRGDPERWRRRAGELGLADRVRFLGERDDMPGVYAACDGLLLPTNYDAFANVCLEAAASGLPVVTSGANGAAEILGKAGRVVDDAQDADAFAAALAELAAPEARRAAGAEALSLARRFTWDAHVSALLALYRQVVA